MCIGDSFNGFYEFVSVDYRRMIEGKRVREKDFDIVGFLNVLEPFYRGGDYDFLLNSDKELDLTNKRFIVFELDNIGSKDVYKRQVHVLMCGYFPQLCQTFCLASPFLPQHRTGRLLYR